MKLKKVKVLTMSLLLALIRALSLLPGSVLAADDHTGQVLSLIHV